MEFLRFGGNIPGEYWGCCAVCIIQNFKQHPDTPASIQITTGDANTPCMIGKEMAFAGPTLRDVFTARIRIGTFGNQEMPNHAFLAVLEQSQTSKGSIGWEWMKILKENGFEFLRAIDNSVYTGPTLTGCKTPHPNYLFGLFRNISNARIPDPFKPPTSWTKLPSVVPEFFPMEDTAALAAEQTSRQLDIWNAGKLTLLPESEIVKAKSPVILTGLRTEFPPETREAREAKLKGREPPKPSNGIQQLYTQMPVIKPTF